MYSNVFYPQCVCVCVCACVRACVYLYLYIIIAIKGTKFGEKTKESWDSISLHL